MKNTKAVVALLLAAMLAGCKAPLPNTDPALATPTPIPSGQTQNPNTAYFEKMLGLLSENKLDEAINMTQEGILLDKKSPVCQNIAMLALKQSHAYALDKYQRGDPVMGSNALKWGLNAYLTLHMGSPLDAKSITNLAKVKSEKPLFPEYALPFDDVVSAINDYAFFLTVLDNNQDAEIYLLNIIALAPDRTVAYLNLADCQWSQDKQDVAKINYNKYVEQMKANGLEKQIPLRARERAGLNPPPTESPQPWKNVDFSGLFYTTSITERDPALEEAIIKTVSITKGNGNRYYYNKYDMNNDGKDEIFVLLYGKDVAGTGGGTGLLFDSNIKLITRFTNVNHPVILSDSMTNGWKDIIMYVAGGGAESHYAILKYKSGKYPGNPTTAPRLSPNAKLKGTAIISDKIPQYLGIEL